MDLESIWRGIWRQLEFLPWEMWDWVRGEALAHPFLAAAAIAAILVLWYLLKSLG